MPLSPRETREILESLGHKPRKRLGQNFLIDGNIVRKSLELANVQSEEHLVEVGPGLGTLTFAMLDTGANVYAVELDDRLHDRLASMGSGRDRFELLHGDAVDFPLATFEQSEAYKKEPYKIVANLPYAISSPWLEAVMARQLPEELVLMLQKEAADRYNAEPGGKTFGAISIFIQSAFERLPGHKVSRQCFYPVPGVDSVLLHMRKKQNPFLFSSQTKEVIRRCFTQRRKQISSLAKSIEGLSAWLPVLEEMGIAGNTRPEAIPVEAWQKLVIGS